MRPSVRGRAFRWIADVGLRRPALVLAIVVAAVLVAGWLSSRLTVSTSRTGLVSEDEPDQARLTRFFARFGRPDAPLFLIQNGTAEQRRAVVDRLQRALEADRRFTGRVLGHLRPTDIAPVLLLHQPDALQQARARLPAGLELAPLVAGGAEAWLAAIADQLERAVEDSDDTSAGAGAPSRDEITAGLGGLATIAHAFSEHLAGGDPLAGLAGQGSSFAQSGIDEAGYLVTGDGRDHLLVIYAELASDEGAELRPMVEGLRAIRDEVMAGDDTGVLVELTGLPAFTVDELGYVTEGLRVSTIIATAGILALCWLLFRSAFQTVVANLPLLPGVVLTLGAVQLLYGHLNLLTSNFVAVLLGLGIDFAVHAISRFNEEVRAGSDRVTATRNALIYTGPGILIGALITAVGFLAGMTTEFTAYAELGVVTAIGLVFVMLATFFVLPPLLGRKLPLAPRSAAPEPPGLSGLPDRLRRHRVIIVVLGLGAAGYGAWELPRIEFNPRYFDFLPERAESSHALTRLEYDPLVSPVFANLTATSVADARRLTSELRALDSVAGVQSPTDILPPLDAAGIAALRQGFAGLGEIDFAALARHRLAPTDVLPPVGRIIDALDEIRFAMAGAGMDLAAIDRARAAFGELRTRVQGLDEAGLARLAAVDADIAAILEPALTTGRLVAARGEVVPTDLPPLFARRFLSKDKDALAVFAVPSGQFWETDVANRFTADMRALDPEASGMAFTHVGQAQMILSGFRRAAVIATLAILVILVLDFRQLRDALFALFPTALGWLWTIAVMGVAGLTFNVANIVALPLIIGVGIAYGVHVIHRLRESDPRPGQSMPAPPTIDDAIRGTGGAVTIAALTTVVGFAALIVSEYGAMRSLGLVMVIGIFACLLATIVALPALLLLVRRAR